MHGCGVSTPKAADVAEATSGLARDMHMANVGMFSIGAKSRIVAAGTPPTSTVGADVATNDAGAAPNVHAIIAPDTTCWPIHPPRVAALPLLVKLNAPEIG
jgi:hypothetical protein